MRADSQTTSQQLDEHVGWPGSGDGGIFQRWDIWQQGPNVILCIIHSYIYSSSVSLCISDHPQLGYVELCDGVSPEPTCLRFYGETGRYGCLGFNGNPGYNPCRIVATAHRTWGSVKAMFR